MRRNLRKLAPVIALVTAFSIPQIGAAKSGDTLINYKLALASKEQGDLDGAYKLFKKACMASDGIVDACLAWADMAEERGDDKGVKRSLGSAVMLDPGNVKARTMLAVKLIKKEDYPWAKEHLTEALASANSTSDLAFLRYYLAYVNFKTGEYKKASELFEQAREDLPANFAKRIDYYQAIIAKRTGEQFEGVALLKTVAADETDKGDKWSVAAEEVLDSWSSFVKGDGVSGRLAGSFGVNTHPSSAFLDTVEADVNPVLQSIFRGDLIYGKSSGNKAFQGILTGYREQNWTEIGTEETEEEPLTEEEAAEQAKIDKYNFNTTVFLGQTALLGRTWGEKFEHEFKLGLDGDVQFLDRPPIKDALGHYNPSDTKFKLIGWTVAGKVWWTFARSRKANYSLRLKVEGRPNYIDKDRSTIRYRLRLNHTRYSDDRKFQLKLMAGTRYDRTYNDPKVIKYDRLMPEAEASLRWNSPWPRMTVLLTSQFKYNWYLNSRQNQKNSFRPQYISIHPESPSIGADMDMDDMDMDAADLATQTTIDGMQEDYNRLVDLLNAYYEHEYYSLTRRDIEWELGGELQFNTWKGGQLVLLYKHHERISNIDDAPVGRYTTTSTVMNEATGMDEEVTTIHSLPSPRFSYTRDMVMLELRQRF